MRKLFSRVFSLVLTLIMALTAFSMNSFAVNYNLPSLYKEFDGYFKIGTFGGWSSQQAKYHFNTSSIANDLKLVGQIGSSNTNSVSAQAYNAAVAAINADPTLTDLEKAAKIEEANENVTLDTGAAAINTLNQIRAYNQANPNDIKLLRAHVLVWHGGQQPNYFFCNGFVYNATNPDWASPQTMLKRLDNYIQKMMQKYAPYNDVIYSWDVVNEAIDDYSGQIRNATDYQVGQWGRIFRRTDLDSDPDARLYAESAFVRQAFASARKWSNQYGADWKLYYNDFQDSNKLYEPKMSQTIKMLKPIHDAGNIDGYGMQGRLAWAYPTIDMLRHQIEMGLTVADEISVSEGDIRSDFEPNPDYNPNEPTRRVTAADDAAGKSWPTYGSGSYANISRANGNTFDVYNSPVRRRTDWGTSSNPTLANSDEVMKKQADFVADWMDLLIEYKDKVVAYQMDGSSDSGTFNSTTGCSIWNNSSNEKYSFFSMMGAPNRDKMRQAIASAPADSDAGLYSPASWQRYVDARTAAQNLVNVRIYTIDGVTAVKSATAALETAIDELTLANKFDISVAPSTMLGPDGKITFHVSAESLRNAWVFEGNLSIGGDSFVIDRIAPTVTGNNIVFTPNISADGKSAYFNIAKVGGFADADQTGILDVTVKLKDGATVPKTLTATLNSIKVFQGDPSTYTSVELPSEIVTNAATTNVLTKSAVLGDFNGDQQLTGADLTVVLTYFGMTNQDPNWGTSNAWQADLDGNNVINIIDITMQAYMVAHFVH